MANYSSDKDLVKIRPDILSLGVEEWSTQHEEATAIINRVVEYKWYRGEAGENGIDWRSSPFDPELLLSAATQLTRLASYKTLELVYIHLMQASAEATAFSTMRDLYAKKYSEELKDVLGAGLDYDWSESGAVSYEEKAAPAIRRLKRM